MFLDSPQLILSLTLNEGYKLVKPVVKLWDEEIRDKVTEIVKRR